MWLTVHYTHPNLEEPFLAGFIALAHKLEVKNFAYVGLNSYNGAYTIKHPEHRQTPPKTGGFLNDFDSVCLSKPGTVDYIVSCMEHIVDLGFDGFTFEESEEGFWYCECPDCRERWQKISSSAGEAKHKANFWLLNQIYKAVRGKKPDVVIGIRAFRQPPLEKDPAFLRNVSNQCRWILCSFGRRGCMYRKRNSPNGATLLAGTGFGQGIPNRTRSLLPWDACTGFLKATCSVTKTKPARKILNGILNSIWEA
jgi:hypothetical protein